MNRTDRCRVPRWRPGARPAMHLRREGTHLHACDLHCVHGQRRAPLRAPIGRRSAVNRGHTQTHPSGLHQRRSRSESGASDLCKQVFDCCQHCCQSR